MIEQTLARNTTTAEVHARELKDAEHWDHALAAESALNP